MQAPLIYIVDDDDAVRDSLNAYLTLMGMSVATYDSGQQLLDSEIGTPQVLIIDLNMPDIDGFMLLEELRKRGVDTPAIFMTGLSDPDARARAVDAGVQVFFDKPIVPKKLLSCVLHLLKKSAS